jgi:hypothetical protein
MKIYENKNENNNNNYLTTTTSSISSRSGNNSNSKKSVLVVEHYWNSNIISCIVQPEVPGFDLDTDTLRELSLALSIQNGDQ